MLKNSYRLKFEKIGMIKYIGHLDLLRVFQRSINRSNLPISYSNGFNPHQIISFALPLSLGFETYGDYLEIELDENLSKEFIMNNLNDTLPKGLRIIRCFKKNKNDLKCAASLCASSYEVNKILINDLANKFTEFYNQEEILTIKKTKKSEKEVNIKKDILDWNVIDNQNLGLILSTGSNQNLKVDIVLKAFYDYCNTPFDIDSLNVYRKEMFYLYNDKLVPLEVGVE